MDLFKTKLTKSNRQLLIVALSLVAAAVTLYVVYAATARRNISLMSPEGQPVAANPSCLLNLTLYRPTPSPSPTPPVCVSSPVDIVLAIDRSGSIGTRSVNGKLSLTYEKEAAIAFVNTIVSQPAAVRANVRIGVVDWAGNNYLVKSLTPTTNLTSVITYINNISYLGYNTDDYTCIECGINKSASLFSDATRRRVIIMMSDGIGNRLTTSCTSTNQGSCTDPTPPACTMDNYLDKHCPKADTAAITAATTAKNNGILIHVVGYGKNVAPVTMLEDNLKAISSGVDYYRYGGVETNWVSVFASIAPEICADLVTPTPSPSPTPITCSITPVDIVLSLDRSKTMGEQGVSGKLKMQWQKDAAIAFINTIATQPAEIQKNVRIGVVDWAGNNKRVKTLALSQNWTNIKTYINNISYQGSADEYTCLECGIVRPTALFTTTTNNKFVLLMSDGIANRITTSCTTTSERSCKNTTPPPCTYDNYLMTHCVAADTKAISSATQMKSSGITYHVVGYGKNVAPVTMLENNLKDIAGNKSTNGSSFYHYGGAENNWASVFSSIAPDICSDITLQ